MNIAICDDDKSDTERLQELLTNYDKERHIGFFIDIYASGNELLAAMDKVCPDVIFLDINMEDMDGITLAGKIREKMDDIPIILVTAFINYAIEGYKAGAVRFLVKDDLERTLPECMDAVLGQLHRKTTEMLFDCVEGEIHIKLSEIIFIETSGHKCVIHLMSQKFHLYDCMDNLESKLKIYGFLRVHQSYIVNIRHIRSINNYILTLDTSVEIKIPRARYKQVREERAIFVGKSL